MSAEIVARHIPLEPDKKSEDVLEFERQLRRRIIGQDEAVSQLVNTFQIVKAGMVVAGRPISNLLFLGPTGSGKTRLIEAAAEILFDTADAVVKIDCAEFQHSHEISKLIGSPPGYIGHRETTPALTQDVINRFHTEKLKLTFVLFDEIEKASDSLWQLLLGVLDKATLTLGDNRKVDFSRTIVCMTSNLGASEMSNLTSGGIGFAPKPGPQRLQDVDRRIYRVAVEAAKRRFSPEFMNRIDKVVVFRTLTRAQLGQILDIELNRVQERILGTDPERIFTFRCTAPAREFLLNEGTDPKYGARHLKRAIERHLVFPLSSLMATEQVHAGDMVTVDTAADGRSLTFTRIEHEPLGGAAGGSSCNQSSDEENGRVSYPRSFMWRAGGR